MADETPLCILVVEDDPDTQANIEDILDLDGHKVIQAASCTEALDREDWSQISAILLDRKLPDGNAEQMLPHFRRLAPHAPVVIVTGFPDVEGAINALRQGAYDYLLKPVSPDVLRAGLRRIAELHTTRKSLDLERNRSQQYLDIAGVIVVALDLEGRVTLTNRKCRQILGYSEEEILGRDWFESFLPPHVQEETRKVFHSLLGTGGEFLEYYENPILTQSGEQRIIDWHNSRIFDPQGNLVGVLASGIDTTQRRQAEQALRASEGRMRAILETAADAIVTFDEGGLIQDINPATEKLFGYCREELIGQNVNLLIHYPASDQSDRSLARYMKSRQAHLGGSGRDMAGRRKDGTPFPIGLTISEVASLGICTGIIRDLSAVRELQKQVLEIAAEADRRVGHELHDNIQQQLTGLGLLATSLAERLEKESSPEAALAARLAGGIKEAGSQVHALARGLVPVEIDAEGLRAALTELAERIGQQCDLEIDFWSAGTIDLADNFAATHLFRIAQEAVNNAIKHSHAKRVEIALIGRDDKITLTVLDDGIGIGEKREVVSGMGLRIMDYRANLIGGSVRFEPGDERGTVVICTVSRGEFGDGPQQKSIEWTQHADFDR